jgi:hypothetical protein
MSKKGVFKVSREQIVKYFDKDNSRGCIKRACKELGVTHDTLLRAAHVYGVTVPVYVAPTTKETRLTYDKRIKDETGHSPRTLRNLNLLDPRIIIFRAVRGRAQGAGKEFDLHISDIVIPDKCPVLGIPLKFNIGNKGPSDNSPALDRIDNTKGYVWNNVIVVSWRANRIKNDATAEELRAIADFYEKLKSPTQRNPIEKVKTTGDKKLTREVEEQIKAEFKVANPPTMEEVGKKYGVARTTVLWILQGVRLVNRNGKNVRLPRYDDK